MRWPPRLANLYESGVCCPAVNDGPHDVGRPVTLLIEPVDGVETTAGGGTAELGVLGERHGSLHTVPGDDKCMDSTVSIRMPTEWWARMVGLTIKQFPFKSFKTGH